MREKDWMLRNKINTIDRQHYYDELDGVFQFVCDSDFFYESFRKDKK